MKPYPEEQETSMKQLTQQTEDWRLNESQIAVGTISVPILRGTWEKKIRKMEGFLKTAYMKEFSLIRALPHSGISIKRVELLWLNPQTLQVGILWPRWMSDITRQVAFQTTVSTHKFDEDHDVIDSMYADVATKVNKADEKKKRVVDYGVFYFDKPQDMSKGATEILILNVTLEKDDIDDGEEMPPGNKVKVLQIICQEKTGDEEENLLDVAEQDAKLGKKFDFICRHVKISFQYLTFIPSSFFDIGKSDPDGKKAGDTVDMKVVKRLIGFFDGHFRKEGVYSNDDMIVFLKPFIGREEAVLQLTMLLYQNGEESTYDVARIMNAFPAGKEDEMHAYVNTTLKEYALKKKKELDAANTAAAAAARPSASNAITTTTTTTGPTTFWNAEAGVATSSLAAAVAKNSPTPVEYGPVDLDVDNEVYGDDDYMPPADASGNKRELEVEK
jgi:hypothetical protein